MRSYELFSYGNLQSDPRSYRFNDHRPTAPIGKSDHVRSVEYTPSGDDSLGRRSWQLETRGESIAVIASIRRYGLAYYENSSQQPTAKLGCWCASNDRT